MATVIVDCETDDLLPNMSRIWCVQIGDELDDSVIVYADQPGYPPLAGAIWRLKNADRIVMHNGLGFDIDAINRFYPNTIREEQIFDTLVAGRICSPTEREHSLEAWGERLQVYKGKYEGNFQSFTQDLVDYAIQDVVATRALYAHLLTKLPDNPERLLEVEHKFARAMVLQERNGFQLDVKAAQDLDATLRGEQSDIERQLQSVFPPIERTQEFTPKVNNKKMGYVKGVPFIKRRQEVFNPGSRHHVAERLQLLGWKPRDFGADGVATVDETTLAGLPWPQAKLMVRYFSLGKQLGQISDGKQAWLKLVRNGRVHGRMNTVGCAPGRCSHFSPNMAQVNKKDRRMRAVWVPRPGWKLVGVDAEGLQARGLAHYLHRYDGGAFAKKVHEGSKKDRSDVHSANLTELARARVILVPPDAPPELWDKGRDGAKRCLYACWFGARDAKLGWTAKDGARNAGLPVPRVPDAEMGRLARTALNRAIRGFEQLSAAIIETASKRGYLISPLGRHVPIRSKHSALVFLMQAVEADVMKLAMTMFMAQCGGYHGIDFALCANVHDEVQLECTPDMAEVYGISFADFIRRAGEELGLKCPLAGSYHVGSSWAETH